MKKYLITCVAVLAFFSFSTTALAAAPATPQNVVFCPGNNQECIDNGVCLQYESCTACPAHNQECIDNGTCLRLESCTACPAHNQECIDNGTCLRYESCISQNGTQKDSTPRRQINTTGRHHGGGHRGHGRGHH